MHVPRRHVLKQGPVIASLVKTAAAALSQKKGGDDLKVPTPEIHQTVKARSNTLIDDYIRHVGGSTSPYKRTVPAHFFPQWGFPLQAKTLIGIPYDMTRVLNGGCRMEIHEQIPRNEKLELSACLEDIDDNGRRAVLRQRITTGTKSVPEALTCYLYAIVPLPKKKGEKRKKKKEKPRVPGDAREIGRWRLHAKAGLEFAVLTGDFNPVHWVPPYARAAGFSNTILHGFSTLARAVETINQTVFSGDVRRLHTVDVKFTRPLILPADVGVYLGDEDEDGQHFFVGDNPGGPAYLTGTFTERTQS